MHCPFCGHVETKVNDSRLAGEGRQIRRRRECLSCGERFTTFETAELVMPMVVKANDVREPYDELKLRAGMEKALEKRPVSREAIDEALSRITHKVRIIGDREVPSRVLGEFVMEELRQLDEVAYVRFASVYRSFQDVEAFHEEIQRLRAERQRGTAEGAREGKRGQKPVRDANRDQLPLLPADAQPAGSASADSGPSSSAPASSVPANSASADSAPMSSAPAGSVPTDSAQAGSSAHASPALASPASARSGGK